MSDWEYNETARQYRRPSGRAVSHTELRGYRDKLLTTASASAEALGRSAALGDITPAAFQTAMRLLLKNTYAAEYMLGRGGRNAMRPADWGRVGAEVKRQYTFLTSFKGEVSGLSEDAAGVRSALYIDGAVQAFERGQAAAHGVGLPAYPGDGGTTCYGNCRCHWAIERNGDTIEATWTLGGADPCVDCVARRDAWSPYTIDAPAPAQSLHERHGSAVTMFRQPA